MFSIIKKISALDSKKLSTAHIGLLQAYAYRALKAQTDKHLSEYELVSSQWAILGMLWVNEEGMKSKEIAHALGVKKPYVTSMTRALLEKGLIVSMPDTDDGRAHFIKLSNKGIKLVPIVEKKLRKSMKGLVAGVSPRDLIGYMKVIKAISDNYKK